jgi:hypothetical protein
LWFFVLDTPLRKRVYAIIPAPVRRFVPAAVCGPFGSRATAEAGLGVDSRKSK